MNFNNTIIDGFVEEVYCFTHVISMNVSNLPNEKKDNTIGVT